MRPNIPDILPFIEAAVEQTQKVVFVFNVDDGEFIYLNDAFEEIWQKKPESVVEQPKSILDDIHKEDREFLVQTYQRLLDGEEKAEVEFRIHQQNNGIKWLNAYATIITENVDKKESQRSVIVGIIEDVSSWKEREINMQKFAAKKNSVLEILSHDMAGHLNNIKGLSGLLSKRIRENSQKEYEEIVKLIEDTSERSIRLIREFVAQEFLASENTSMVKERVDLVEKMSQIIDQYKDSEEELKKTFYFRSSSEKIFVQIDAFKFSQVINNLLSNAIKFTKDGGEIVLSLEDKAERVLVSLVDDGVGIPEKYHDELFEKFTKARRPGLKGEPSTGLGMSIIRTIVEWHDGKIWFKSKENEGSTFFIELPKD